MRRYGTWAGKPKGWEEDLTRCIVEVPDGGRSCTFHQCRNKRGKGPDGLYCTQHAKKIEQGHSLFIPKEG